MSSNIREAREQVQDLKRELQELKGHMRTINDALTMYLALTRKMGLPPQVTQLLINAQRARMAIITLQTSIQAFYAATGPLGYVLAAGGLFLGGMMAADLATEAYSAIENERRGDQW